MNLNQVSQVDLNQICKSVLFAGLTPEQVERILPCIVSSEKKYEKDERVYHKGDIVGNLGLVISGSLSICSVDKSGRKVVITNIGKNQLFGEAVIFSSGNELPHDVFANEPTHVLYFASDFFIHTCGENCVNRDSHTEVMKNMLRILADRTIILNRKISYLTAPDLRTKLAMYIYDLHQATGLLTFNMPLNRDGLAEYLAVARPSLSREFVNLKKIGVIDFYRSSVKILDLPSLFSLAHPE